MNSHTTQKGIGGFDSHMGVSASRNAGLFYWYDDESRTELQTLWHSFLYLRVFAG